MRIILTARYRILCAYILQSISKKGGVQIKRVGVVWNRVTDRRSAGAISARAIKQSYKAVYE